MKRSNGVLAVNDDEWYTPRATADAIKFIDNGVEARRNDKM